MINKTYLEFRQWFEKSSFIGCGLEEYLFAAWCNAKYKYKK